MDVATLPEATDVLIVGGGPVGLATAIELGLRGISTVLVEQRARAGAQPRAKTTNVRSMQHMRRWGIAGALRDAAPLPPDYPTDIVFATRLFGHTLAVIPNAFEGAKRRDPRFPEPAQWVPQYTVEDVMRERVGRLPSVTVAFGVALQGATQSDDAVTATVADAEGGASRTVRARYLVGADGARSSVRGLMGARMEGQHAFAFNYNLIVRIPELAGTPPPLRSIMYWLVNARSAAVMGPMDRDGVWFYAIQLPPGVKDVPDDEMIRRVQDAVGRPVEVEIITRDIWAAHRLIADRYRDRRIILAGDACHLHPPFGGYGMNLGIADGVDLGWKLAAVLRGWGGDGLLDAYEAERRPVHLRTIAEAVENYRVLSADLIKDSLEDATLEGEAARQAVGAEIVATKTREFSTLGVVLGSRYEASPLVVDDGSSPPAEHYADYQPSAHPGCLAPHAWLDETTSLYDRFGPGYTLLVLADGADPAVEAIRGAADAVGMPLDLLDVRAAGLEGLYGAKLALIRPDHHVAWRGQEVANAAGLVDRIRGTAAPARQVLDKMAS